jgi:sulfite reductase (NADPH) hemoprotein beta-component
MANDTVLTPVEHIKARSNYLRGTIRESLADTATGALAEDDTQLSKFHGFYQQDDRDLRSERTRQKLEPAYSFMIRVRVPGGIATPAQWLALDELATSQANNTLRLTTRQAFQFHGVVKGDLQSTIRRINYSLLDTIAACGDVNRNVMCTPVAEVSAVHEGAYRAATQVSEHLTPQTTAYHEIWLDGEKVAGTQDHEPIYGATYLPRKFKIAVAIPPSNDVDIFAQDLGYIAIEEGGKLVGFNVAVGGGMGVTHGEAETYPRVADVIGFCTPGQVVEVAEHVVGIQRDNGDRTNRKHARLKYTIDDRSVAWFKDELAKRLGYRLPEPKAVPVHLAWRCLWLGEGPARFVAPDAVHSRRPHPGSRQRASADRLARTGANSQGRLPAYREPEPDCERYFGG